MNSQKTITVQELRRLLPCGDEFIFDASYILPTQEEIQLATQQYIKQRGEFDYVANYHDCDNASAEMMVAMSGKGWPFGMAIIPGHAVCVCVDDQENIIYIEPQNGERLEVPEILQAVFII